MRTTTVAVSTITPARRSVATLLFAICAITAVRCPARAQSLTHQISLPAGMTWCGDGQITGLLTQVNAYRAENGRPALQVDSLGMKDAELRATQFAAYMATHTPNTPGFNPHEGYDTTAASLGYNIVSENLAYMTSDPAYVVYAAWQDPLHIAAMLANDANVAGVSCIYFNGIPYWSYEPGVASQSTPPPPSDEETTFLTLINQYRAQNGAGPLQLSPTLENSAAWMANDMATKNYASHTDSLGRSVGTRLAAFGYTYVPYGENIAGGYSDAQTAFNQWKDACDPDTSGTCTYAHRKNMLNASFAAIGIGRAYSATSTYGWYWVTDFGGYVDSGSPPPPPQVPVISSFHANPSAITAGQSATLTWTVSGATILTIDNGVGDVTGQSSKVVFPSATTAYHITATNTAGTAAAMATVTVSTVPVPDAQAPTAPVLNSATATSQTSVALSWRASTDNLGVAGYQILRNGSPAGSVGGTVLAFTDTGAAPNTAYKYTVRAVDAAGNYSIESNTVQVTTPTDPSSTCPAPAEGAFTGCYYNSVDLSGTPALVRTDPKINFNWWYVPPSPAVSRTAFSVRWQGKFALDAGSYIFVVTASDGIRLYLDGTPIIDRWRDQSATSYMVRRTVSAGVHLIGVEYYERTGTPTVYVGWQNTSPGTVPVINSFTVSPQTIAAGQSAVLSWSVSGASTVTIDNGVGDVSATASRQVAPGQTTTYRLTATNSAGLASATATVTVNGSSGADRQAPATPTLKSAVANSATRVDLSWTSSSDNVGVAGYQVVRNGTVLASISAATLAYADMSASPNSSYTYAVRAFDAAGNASSLSNNLAVTTPGATASGTCTPAVNAFTGCYYNNLDLSGTPALIRTDSQINFDWRFTTPDGAVPGTNYSIRWQGTYQFDQDDYTFYVTASDGVRLYIDGTLVLDRWRDQPSYSYLVRRTLTPGAHLITMEYYERTGTAEARLSWKKN